MQKSLSPFLLVYLCGKYLTVASRPLLTLLEISSLEIQEQLQLKTKSVH